MKQDNKYPPICGTCKNYMSKIMCPVESKGYNPSHNSDPCDKYSLDDLFINAYKWRKPKQCNWLEEVDDRERP